MKTPVSENTRDTALSGLKAFNSTQTHLIDGVQAATALHLDAAREQSAAVLACATAFAKAEPSDLPKVMFERSTSFMHDSIERAVRLGQDLMAIGQKTGSSIQGAVKVA